MGRKKRDLDTIEGLRQVLGECKDREAQLEADLAIRENPLIEEAVMNIAIRLVDLKNATNALRTVKKPKGEKSKRIEQVRTQLEFYRERVKALELLLEELLGKDSANLIKLEEKCQVCRKKLKEECDRWEDILVDNRVSLTTILPSIQDHLKTD